MCGRFFISPDDMMDDELIALLNREKGRSDNPHPLTFGEVRPGDCAAVIAMNRRLQCSAFPMQWGYRVNQRLLINARSETAAEKPLFRESWQDRRCLIPASGYFEWDHRERPFKKYAFRLPERKLIYLAGLYRFEPDAPLPVFTILTRPAAEGAAQFHARMPVIIPPAMKASWLDRSQNPQTLLSDAVTTVSWQLAE